MRQRLQLCFGSIHFTRRILSWYWERPCCRRQLDVMAASIETRVTCFESSSLLRSSRSSSVTCETNQDHPSRLKKSGNKMNHTRKSKINCRKIGISWFRDRKCTRWQKRKQYARRSPIFFHHYVEMRKTLTPVIVWVQVFFKHLIHWLVGKTNDCVIPA